MNIRDNFKKGYVEMLILNFLSEKDLYGYEMIEALRARSNNVFELKAGTLYPLLHALEEKSFLTSYEKEIGGKTRKYYSITDAGKKHLNQKKKEWNEYSQAVAGILTLSAEGV